MVWSLLVAEQALKQKGYGDIAARYGRYNEILSDNVVKMFYDPAEGKVRGDVKVLNPQSADSFLCAGAREMRLSCRRAWSS